VLEPTADAEISGYTGGGIYLAAIVLDAIRTGWTTARLAELLAPLVALRDPEQGALFVPDGVYEAAMDGVYRAVYPGWPKVRPEWPGEAREQWLREATRPPVAA
jgi:hypothetical protein